MTIKIWYIESELENKELENTTIICDKWNEISCTERDQIVRDYFKYEFGPVDQWWYD